jgi:hypothetical protein
LQSVRRTYELGRRLDVPELQALGRVFEGYVLVQCHVA